MMDIKIVVATHKKYRMPEDSMYMPIQVGKKGKKALGYAGDDTGENISDYNSRFCELTAIFWAWKNLKADYIGLVHYRRHFTGAVIKPWGVNRKYDVILSSQEAASVLKEYDLILPKQRKYYIESKYSHFIHLPYAHQKDIDMLRQVICELKPDYISSFDIVMNRSHGHMFNMFIMKRELFDGYCQWAFPILFEVDRRINVSDYSPEEMRAVSYLGEFMIDIWNEKQKIPYKEVPVMFMEKRNWIIKGGKFLYRKLRGETVRKLTTQ